MEYVVDRDDDNVHSLNTSDKPDTNRFYFLVRVERRRPTGDTSGLTSSSLLRLCLLCRFDPALFGFGSSSSSSSLTGVLLSSFVALFRLDPPWAALESSPLMSFDTGPVFFCTLGTTALVRPPTVRKTIFSPLGRAEVLFFFPLLHRCLNSQSSGNLSESARRSTEVEQT